MSQIQTQTSIFDHSNLVKLIQFRAAVQPNDTAFLYLKDGVGEPGQEVRLTYKELDERCRALGGWLQQNHYEGKRILLLYPPGLDFIIGFFGCLYAGATAVPIYPPTKNRKMLRIQAVADSAEASLALTVEETMKRVRELINETPDLKRIAWLTTDVLPVGYEEKWSDPNLDSDALAFLQYTSGSTGNPKGVMITHGNMLHNSLLISTGFEHTRSHSGVFWLPSYHDMGLIGGIIQPIYCGRPNVIMSPMSFMLKPFRWLAAISKYRATTSGGPNFAYDYCIKGIREEVLDRLDLSCWQVAFNGAEPVQAETMERFAKKFERCGFRYEAFYPCFGLAEGTLIVTGGQKSQAPIIKNVDADSLAAGSVVDAIPGTDRVRQLVSSGRIILDQTVRIVDPETKKVCPDNKVGEIWTSSPSVAKGYWKNPAATEETFHAYTSDTKEGPFMRTGDLGFMSGGELFVTGRIKDLIILRGVNVYPQDIEATAQHTVPDLLRVNAGGAFMVGADNEEKLVLIQEVERRFKEGDEKRIFPEIRKAIAIEHEVPIDTIVLVRSGSVPKTSSGKVQRHACREGFLKNELNEVARWSLAEETGDQINIVTLPKKKSAGGYTDADNPLNYDPNAENLVDDDDKIAGSKKAPAYPGSEMANVFKVEPKSAPKPEPAPEPARLSLAGQSYQDTVKTVLEEVHRIAKERARGATLDTDITELGLDSLERMEILASLEDKFGGQFPEAILPDLITARDVVNAVREHLGHGVKVEEREGKIYEVTDASNDFASFPEYLELRRKLDFAEKTHLNHFFDVHDTITDDVTYIRGKKYINFASYNYIGASGHPEVIEAAQKAAKQFGTSASASRIVSGTKPVHVELERAIADFLGTDDSLTFTAGHQTNESVIGHLMNQYDMILYDAVIHNSSYEGALLSGARRRPFPHNDYEAAEWILKKHRQEYRRVLLVLEGVYSMDGDYPDLPKFVELRNRYKTLLMIDEAHSIGVLGKTGRGIGEFFNVNRRDVDLWMCTLSKTFGACGGYIAGRQELIDYLKYTTPAFMFSAAMSPPVAAAALASIRLLEREPQRCEQLRANSRFFKKTANELGLNTGLATESGVVTVVIGNSVKCLKLSKYLFDHGVNANPILHPAVEEKAARIRFFLTWSHTESEMRTALELTAQGLAEIEREDNEVQTQIFIGKKK
ncbi:MAG: aminotransferase class I/II-fold pyridoxal phosphate-dependent enzyme [Thermoguttaceae bacterium]|nr:aminotransferase class I/II-fold pyridoxal phosphate-dependent enzyme [Thermoguttaceae bacterium]